MAARYAEASAGGWGSCKHAYPVSAVVLDRLQCPAAPEAAAIGQMRPAHSSAIVMAYELRVQVCESHV